jgi:hypothetical protein
MTDERDPVVDRLVKRLYGSDEIEDSEWQDENDRLRERIRQLQSDNHTLAMLLDKARDYKMTEAEKETQRRSFAYGNVHMHNPSVTRELVDEVADRMCSDQPHSHGEETELQDLG